MQTLATVEHIFSLQMAAIRKQAASTDRQVTEDRADRELIAFTQKKMREALAKARTKGRQGWWSEADCQIEHLEDLLSRAFDQGDMISVINYAAMIEARRIADG